MAIGINFDLKLTVFSGLQVAPEYKPHPLFLRKIWEKFIDKSHLSISHTLFCYFLVRRNILGCIHMMRRSAKDRQDAIDVVQKTLHVGLIAWVKVCSDAVIWCQAKTSGVCPTKWVNCVTCVGQKSGVTHKASLIAILLLPPGGQSCVLSTGLQAGVFPRSAGACSRRPPGRHVLQCGWLPLESDTTRPRIQREREREREKERHSGRGRGGHTAAETVSDCGVLWVSWSWSSADRGMP